MSHNLLKTGSAILAALLLLSFSALAADVDGKWTGMVSTPNGDFPQAFTFKADGATLTGSMTGIDGAEVAIKDGKINGANISFTVSLDSTIVAIMKHSCSGVNSYMAISS